MNEDLLLETRKLVVSVKQNKALVPIVKGIDLKIKRGSITGIVGESGCGKTMTARSINGILPAGAKVTGGNIFWYEKQGEATDLTALKEKQLRKKCGLDIAMIFQEPMTSLNPLMRIGDQIKEALTIHGLEKDHRKAKERVIQMLDKVGIPQPELRYDSFPHELSGGMRQRVMIAMAMICSPELLIADEATTALDVTTQAQILDMLRDMCSLSSMSALVISHNMGVISSICDYVYVMYLGRIMEQAPVEELFSNPLHPYTRGLLSSIPKMDNNPEYLETIPGDIPVINPGYSGCPFAIRCSDDIKDCFTGQPPMISVGNDHYVCCHMYSSGVTGA